MSKTDIKKETRVSAPTIRRIIRESEKGHTQRYYHPLRSGETLLLNLTRHWPQSRSRNIFERLMNGTAFRLLPNVLLEIYPPNMVNKIINEIKMNSLGGSIVEVCYYLDENNDIIVKTFGLIQK